MNAKSVNDLVDHSFNIYVSFFTIKLIARVLEVQVSLLSVFFFLL